MKFLKYVFALVALTLLAACGGGGGNPGTPTGGGTAAKPSLVLRVFNSGNVAVSEVTSGGGNYVKAVFKDADGAPITNRTVTFSVNSGLATLAKTTELTNSVGEAQVDIFPTAGSTGGAITVQASALNGTATITGSVDVAVASGGIPAGPQISLQFFNSANLPVSNVTFGGGNYVKATFKNGSGAPIVSRLVTFSLNGASIALISSSTAITNSSGEAQVSIAPVSVAAVGAATLSVQSTEGGVTYSASADFGVSPTAITLSSLTLGSNSLISGGNTSVMISATSNAVAAAGVNVALTADCGTINPVATTDGSGVATATYSAVKTGGSSCSGVVTLTASTSGAIGVQKASLNVAAPVANAINFVSATPGQIFVKASGAIEQSLVLFKVLDSTGVAMPNIPVVFSLTMNPGGVGLGASGATANVTANSDALGVASISVFSGTIPGPVEVKAALASTPSVFTTSKNLTVASGPPSQNHLSLSVSTFNIEGWDVDGSSTTLTVRVADRQGNPVPDGTVINFTTEGGQVKPSCATKLDAAGHAACSVGFISQQPRPADGRVSVLAYVEGLKEYIDVNGNNAYDAGIDTLVDIGDAYRDDNENGQYDAAGLGEFVIPKGGTTACAGAGGASPARANTCTGAATQATTVRQQTVLLFASSRAQLTVMQDAVAGSDSIFKVRLNSYDPQFPQLSLLPMPAGTTIAASTSATGCKIGAVTPSVVPNISPGAPGSQLGWVHTIALSCSSGGTIVITATTPGGVVSSFSYYVPAVPIVCTFPQYPQNGVCVSPPPADTTPPTFPAGDPAVDLITQTSFRLTAMINESGTGYYLLQDRTAFPAVSCPAVTGLILTPGNPGVSGTISMPANGPVAVNFTGKTANRAYAICFVASDTSSNAQATVKTIIFNTLP